MTDAGTGDWELVTACWLLPAVLEQEPDTQLHVATRVVLAGHATEGGARRVAARTTEVRVIQEVEHLCAQLEGPRTLDADILEQRDVPLILARVVDVVPRTIAE